MTGWRAIRGSEPELELLTGVKCVACGSVFDACVPQSVCRKCGSMLSATYDVEALKEGFTTSSLVGREASLWRYREVLPVVLDTNIVSLGEGFSPIIRLGGGPLLVKDDGVLPTGTFKARGMSVAVSKAKELGISCMALPSAGNAGAALACYAAVAGVRARVYMPTDAPESNAKECRAYGAELVFVEGNISDAAQKMADDAGGWFDVSTLKEPYRLEGKKTMGYEIAEQLRFMLPDVIVYPTGGGTGLLGMWKAFGEMEQLGWVGGARPRMVSVQSESCKPLVEAFSAGRETLGEPVSCGSTVASGLRVPKPFAAREILRVLKESDGLAVAVADESILQAMRSLARQGVFACPEGAATYAAYEKLLEEGTVGRDERALLYNTGTGLKYLGLYQ